MSKNFFLQIITLVVRWGGSLAELFKYYTTMVRFVHGAIESDLSIKIVKQNKMIMSFIEKKRSLQSFQRLFKLKSKKHVHNMLL